MTEDEFVKIACYMSMKYYNNERVVSFNIVFRQKYDQNEYLAKELTILKKLNYRIYRTLVYDLITKNHSDLFNYLAKIYINGSNITVKEIARIWDNK